MSRREPPDVAILAARLMRAWPSLSPYSCAHLATELCAIERAQRRHAERQCNGEDGGYVRAVNVAWLGGRRVEHNPEAEQRAGNRIARRVFRWKEEAWKRAIGKAAGDPAGTSGIMVCDIELQGDPRGSVLLLRLPGEKEASTV